MSPWVLLQTSEAARAIAWWAIIGGWLTGFAFCAWLFWRRLTAPSRAEAVRLLCAEHEDQRRQLEAQLGDAGFQIRELLGQNARLAALYTAAKADGTREVGRVIASGRKH